MTHPTVPSCSSYQPPAIPGLAGSLNTPSFPVAFLPSHWSHCRPFPGDALRDPRKTAPVMGWAVVQQQIQEMEHNYTKYIIFCIMILHLLEKNIDV